jgi:hypothetical protein
MVSHPFRYKSADNIASGEQCAKGAACMRSQALGRNFMLLTLFLGLDYFTLLPEIEGNLRFP